MLLREPEDHLIPHEDRELLLELATAFRFREATRDCHDSRREESFSCQGAHELLQIGGESERHGLGVVKMGLVGDHGRDQLRTPDISRGTRDGELVGKAASHVHDVGHKRKGSELVRHLAAEEEEVGIGLIGRLEVVERNFIGDPFALNSCEYLRAKGMILRLIHLIWRRRPKSFHGEQNGFVLVLVIAPAMIFVDALK